LAEDKALIHATCLALGDHGILIIGPPGSGKSDLALRLLDCPGSGTGADPLAARLVSDDQTLVMRRGDRLFGTSPATISGKLEIRGIGVVDVPYQQEAMLSLVVRLKPVSQIERMPPETGKNPEFCGIPLAEISLDSAMASAPARIRAALGHLVGR
jgi:HPr kinase/phosphorylase